MTSLVTVTIRRTSKPESLTGPRGPTTNKLFYSGLDSRTAERETMSKEAADYAKETRFEADMVTDQSDNQFLRDLHAVRAELAANETEAVFQARTIN